MRLNGYDIHKAININDDRYPFTEWILDGLKTIETRRTPSLSSCCGHRVAIIRTLHKQPAMIVGTAIVGLPVYYTELESFLADTDKHMVPADDIDYGFRDFKTGYPLYDVQRLETPIHCTSRGIVIRNI